MSLAPSQQARPAAIAAEIARLAGGFALPGTVADRMTRCGHIENPGPRNRNNSLRIVWLTPLNLWPGLSPSPVCAGQP